MGLIPTYKFGGTYGSRTHLKGFADLYVTVPSTRHMPGIVSVFRPFDYLFNGSRVKSQINTRTVVAIPTLTTATPP